MKLEKLLKKRDRLQTKANAWQRKVNRVQKKIDKRIKPVERINPRGLSVPFSGFFSSGLFGMPYPMPDPFDDNTIELPPDVEDRIVEETANKLRESGEVEYPTDDLDAGIIGE